MTIISIKSEGNFFRHFAIWADFDRQVSKVPINEIDKKILPRIIIHKRTLIQLSMMKFNIFVAMGRHNDVDNQS